MWKGEEDVKLVDAVRSGAPTGTVHRVGIEAEDFTAGIPLTAAVREAVERVSAELAASGSPAVPRPPR